MVNRDEFATLLMMNEADLYRDLWAAQGIPMAIDGSDHDDLEQARKKHTALQEQLECLQERQAAVVRRRRWAILPRHRRALALDAAQLASEINASKQVVAEAAERSGALERAKEQWWATYERWAERGGREVFEGLVPRIRVRLCEHWRACEQVKLYDDQTTLGMAIAHMLSAAVPGAPVATVAALVVKAGVKTFCNCPST